jgi:hypothetical protein
MPMFHKIAIPHLTLPFGSGELKMETFADTSAFNAGVKEKNTKTNKITIVKNEKLATQNFSDYTITAMVQ